MGKTAKNHGKNQKCRRADIFEGMATPLFLRKLGKEKDLPGQFPHRGEIKELGEFREEQGAAEGKNRGIPARTWTIFPVHNYFINYIL